MENKKLTFTSRMFVVITALVLALIIVVMAFIPERYTLLDATRSKYYGISKSSIELISSLDEDVTIYLLNSDGGRPELEIFLEKYAQYGKNVTLEHVNTKKDTEFFVFHGYDASATVSNNSIMVYSEKRNQVIDASYMYTYTNSQLGFSSINASEYSYYYSLFSQSEDYAQYLEALLYDTVEEFDGEALISAAVEYVTVDEIPRMYFIEGHGEDSAVDGVFASNLSSVGYGYGVHDITKSEGIPSDASCIVVNSPENDYSDNEAELILDYLKNGGNMILLTSAENIKMENLMSIAEYYGVTSTGEKISENPEAEEGEESDADVTEYTVVPIINSDHDLFSEFNSYSGSLKNAMPIKISEDLRKSQLVTPVLSTSDRAYTDNPDNTEIYTVGVAVEEETAKGTTKLVWITGAESFNGESAGDVSDTANQSNILLMLYSAIWTEESYKSNLGAVPNAVWYEDVMLNVSEFASGWLGVLFIFVIPVAVIGIGLFVYFYRKRK